MTISERVQAPTPKFFKTVRNGGLLMATIGASLLSAPVGLPPFLLKLAGYLTVAGGVAAAISQTATSDTSTASSGSSTASSGSTAATSGNTAAKPVDHGL